jgi:hypothetical protein
MITLTLNGDPLPPILTAGVAVELDILVDGVVPLQTVWTVWTTVKIAEGTGSKVVFTPVSPVTTIISVMAVKPDSTSQTQAFTVQVMGYPTGPVETWINWSQLKYAKGDTIDADILFSSPQGLGYQSVTWNLYRNSIWQASGDTNKVHYQNADHGVYRIVARITDFQNNIITGDSSTVVAGDFEVQSALRPLPGKTKQFLGYVYTGEQIGEAAFSSSIGMSVSAMAEEIYLLPGTTYFQVELDPESVNPPDQVLVRTPTGNWSVLGQPPGAVDLPYEFLENTFIIPAPADIRLQLSTESFATHIGPILPFRFRIRIKCFYDRQEVYAFQPCPGSSSVGGAGMRARRFAVVFSDLDLLTDTDTTEQRMGSSPATLQHYRTDIPNTLPMPLSLDGLPDLSDETHRMFYTNQNWVTSYDPTVPGVLEVDANSTYAIENARPFTISFMMPAYPTIIQRPRRVSGKVAVYLANGFVNQGTVVTLRLLTAGGYGTETVSVPITADAFSPDLETYLKIGEADVDISDGCFIDNGLVGIVTLDETGADLGTWPMGTVRPDPVPLEGTIYSTTSAPFARFDGACYHNTGLVDVMMGTTTSSSGTYTVDVSGTIYPMVADIVACYDPKCAPVGMFCYGQENVDHKMHVPQPLYDPAPFVAPADNVTLCHCNPCLIEEWVGTLYGTFPPHDPYVAYTNGSMCGVPYGFVACNGTSSPLVIPYPGTTVPPDYVCFQGTCYGLYGSLPFTTGYQPVLRSDVEVVYDCQDVICTGSVSGGMVFRYRDPENQRDVDVYMNHVDNGMPFFAVVPETYNDGINGLTTGEETVGITANRPEQPFLSVAGQGTLSITVSADSEKQIVRYRNSVPSYFVLRQGIRNIIIDVLPGDVLAFRMYAKKAAVNVTWKPWVPRPRLYAAGTLYPASPTPIRSVGFTGLTDRSEYRFYGTLPVDITASEINPDSILTVQSAGAEYVLVRCRGINDSVPALPYPSTWYGSNTPLAGPLVFKLYAGREDAGFNGDMDVWLGEEGELPHILAANPFQSLVRYGTPPPTNRVPEVERNSLRVVENAYLYRWPSAYISDSGTRIVVAAPPVERYATVIHDGGIYTWAGTEPGAAFDLLEWNFSGSFVPKEGVTVESRALPDGTRMFIAVVDMRHANVYVTYPGGTRDTVRQTTLDFAQMVYSDLAFNGNFFLPFPSFDLNAASVGFTVSSTNKFSPFEPQPIGFGYPNQSYAILPYAPALNFDANFHAAVVHRNPAFGDNKHILEAMQLVNTVSGSAQVITNGVKTIPIYGTNAGQLSAISGYSNSNSWYDLIRARTVAGVTLDQQTLVICVVEGVSGSSGGQGGMRVGDIADILIQDYKVYNAINLDGGGSSGLVLKDQNTGTYHLLNTSPDGPLGRAVAVNVAITLI